MAESTVRTPGRSELLAGGALVGAITLLALLAPVLAGDPTAQGDLRLDRFLAPSADHLLGTDRFGRDVWARLLHGARISLAVGVGAAALAATIGTAVGAVAGWRGGWVDALLMRMVDVVLAFPRIVLVVVVVALYEPSLPLLVLVLGATQWPTTARLVRSEILSLREREFIVAARALGIPEGRVVVRHLLPNAIPPVLVATALGVGYAVLLEAGLSFLGLGVPAPTPSWGGMIADGRAYLLDAWWLATAPGIALVLLVLGFNLLGDGLRARLDPRRVG